MGKVKVNGFCACDLCRCCGRRNLFSQPPLGQAWAASAAFCGPFKICFGRGICGLAEAWTNADRPPGFSTPFLQNLRGLGPTAEQGCLVGSGKAPLHAFSAARSQKLSRRISAVVTSCSIALDWKFWALSTNLF